MKITSGMSSAEKRAVSDLVEAADTGGRRGAGAGLEHTCHGSGGRVIGFLLSPISVHLRLSQGKSPDGKRE